MREDNMSEGKTVTIGRALTRRQTMAGGATALVAAPFVIRSGFAQGAAVNIGVIQPLSGANAQFGIICRNGVELGADKINTAGGIKALGGAKINLVVSDATSNPTAATAAAQRLISQNELTAILGAFASSLTLAISEVTARADIPMLTASFADEITGRGLESVFKVTATASAFGRAQVNYTLAIAVAAGSKIDKIATMYEDTAYGVAQTRGLRRAAKDANIEVVMDEPYPLGITDATPLINKLRASGAQAVFPVSYLNDSLFIIRAMRQQRITIPVIGGAAGYVISRLREGARRIRRGRALDLDHKLRSRPCVDGPIPQALRRLHGAQRNRFCGCSRRARAGDRASEVGKAASGDRGPARRALRRRLDQSDARRCGSVRSDRPQHACGTDHGPVAQEGTGDGMAEGFRQS
jgi:ABC-type branched-subunit amino acid transport system substrate-binding protein